jgi:hypothetical protein
MDDPGLRLRKERKSGEEENGGASHGQVRNRSDQDLINFARSKEARRTGHVVPEVTSFAEPQ